MNPPDYLIDIKKAFEKNADPENAVQMKKYMKDRYDFYGISSPIRKELFKTHWKRNGYNLNDNAIIIIEWCWNAPQREFQYFGMELLGKQTKNSEMESIKIYESIITHKSWWDTVDFIASNLVGVYFNRFPDQIESITDNWMKSGNIWLQRSCLLFQLKYKSQTDTALLEKFIDPLSGSKEFFIRKAIGWALREYSKTDPKYVIQYVNNHSLSSLSEREALKWMKNTASIN